MTKKKSLGLFEGIQSSDVTQLLPIIDLFIVTTIFTSFWYCNLSHSYLKI